MKHIPTFENFLNEAVTSDITKNVQAACKKGVTEAQKELNKLLNDAVKAGLLKSFKTNVVKYTSIGYALQIKPKDIDSDVIWYAAPSGSFGTKFKKNDEKPTPQEAYFAKWMTANCISNQNEEGVILIASTRFVEEYNENKGRPYLEGTFFSVIEPSSRYGELQVEYLESYDVKEESDITKATLSWVSKIKEQLNVSRNLMGL